MRKISLVLIILTAFLASCTEDFQEFNEDEINPAKVPGDALFSNAQVNLADQNASANVNLNIWKLWAQYWTETTYTDEANYDIVNRTIADNAFRTYYRNILKDFDEAKKLIAAEEDVFPEDPIIKENKLQIINLLEVYAYQRLVDIFGMVPYGEALDIDNLQPAYVDGMTIYNDLITRTTDAINNLDASQGSFGSADLYYHGDVSMWIKFANAMKLKLGIMLADVDATKAQTAINEAMGGDLLASNDENTTLVYTNMPPNTNPIHEDLVLSGRKDFVAANTIVDMMNMLEDPRMDAYFDYKIDTGGGNMVYLGGDYGYSSSYSNYSHVDNAIIQPDYPSTLYGYVEQLFYMAEAEARFGGDAETYYNDAITASFLYWGLTEADAQAYLEKPEVMWDETKWKELIGTQSWIAYYVRGFNGWTTWRRLDYPAMNMPPSPAGNCITEDFPVPARFTFPINEQTLNADNYFQAANAIGGDDLCNKLFWDVN